MKIMVPVDGSRFSEQAIDYAVDLAAQCGGSIDVTRVHEIPIDALVAQVSPYASVDIDRELRDAEVQYLRTLPTRFDNHTPMRMYSLDAPVADALARHVADGDIDLVVMTTHGRGGLSRAWVGSVADRVVRTTNVPVLLLRPDAKNAVRATPRAPHHILIPLDGSSLSESVIESATALGVPSNARYTLMQVVPAPITASKAVTVHSANEAASLRKECEAYLERCAEQMRLRGLLVDTQVVIQDNVAAAIVEEALACECDLIAMATHGRSGWARFTLGSVADKVLRTAPAPLLVLRPVCHDALNN